MPIRAVLRAVVAKINGFFSMRKTGRTEMDSSMSESGARKIFCGERVLLQLLLSMLIVIHKVQKENENEKSVGSSCLHSLGRETCLNDTTGFVEKQEKSPKKEVSHVYLELITAHFCRARDKLSGPSRGSTQPEVRRNIRPNVE